MALVFCVKMTLWSSRGEKNGRVAFAAVSQVTPPHAIIEVYTTREQNCCIVFCTLRKKKAGHQVGVFLTGGETAGVYCCTPLLRFIVPLPATAWLPGGIHVSVELEREHFKKRGVKVTF